MTCEAKLDRLIGIPQLFITNYGPIFRLLIVKLIDYFLISVKRNYIENFTSTLKQYFDISNVLIGYGSPLMGLCQGG